VPRKPTKSVAISPNVRFLRVYPMEGTKKGISELKTVGIKLSRAQAIDLARSLLAVSQDWEEVDVTAYRLERRKSDGTYHVTVTSAQPD